MGEEDIVRTTLYLPKNLYKSIRKEDINLSRMVRSYLEIIIDEDELDIIEKEIESLKKKIKELEAKKQYLLERRKKEKYVKKQIFERAKKLCNFITPRLQLVDEQIYSLAKNSQFFKIIREDYGISFTPEDLIKLRNKVNNNGKELHPEDLIPLFIEVGGES